jgi:hypothetical protein
MNEYIVADYGSVRTIKEGHEIIVQKLVNDAWVWVASYHEISDDYAFTNARNRALAVKEEMSNFSLYPVEID